MFDFAAVAVQFHMNPHSKSPWLALYVPYLVINRTGLPIRVRPFYDEKKKKTVNPEHADRMRQLQQVEWSRETQADFNAALHGVTIHKGGAALHRSISKHPVVKRHSQTEFADAVNDPMPLLLGSAATWKECEMLQLSLDGTTYSNIEFNDPPTNAKEPLKVRTAAHLPPVLLPLRVRIPARSTALPPHMILRTASHMISVVCIPCSIGARHFGSAMSLATSGAARLCTRHRIRCALHHAVPPIRCVRSTVVDRRACLSRARRSAGIRSHRAVAAAGDSGLCARKGETGASVLYCAARPLAGLHRTEPKAQRPNRYLPCLAARARRRQACAVAIRPAE